MESSPPFPAHPPLVACQDGALGQAHGLLHFQTAHGLPHSHTAKGLDGLIIGKVVVLTHMVVVCLRKHTLVISSCSTDG